MALKSCLLSLAFVAAAIASPLEDRAAPKDPKPPKNDKCATFDAEKLSLREVGARNTLVSCLVGSREILLIRYRTGASGLNWMASPFLSGMTYPCIPT